MIMYLGFWGTIVVFSSSEFDNDRVIARAVFPLYWNGSGGFLGCPLLSEIDRIGACSRTKKNFIQNLN